MARRPSSVLTEGELRIMTVLWRRGPSTAQEIAAELSPPRATRNSVMTLLSVLERKGYVRHDQRERTYVFSALVDARGARGRALSNVLAKFFGDHVGDLMASLVDARSLTADEIRAARSVIDEAARRNRASRKAKE
jgi:BlaI family transcriptional regulator, penicillinase repressor